MWQDKRQVSVLSTLTTPDDTVPIRRKEKDRTQTTLSCPTAMYNRHMAGVDKGDQLRCYYRLRLKFMKNYKYIFFFLLDTAITNAYILYNNFSSTDKKLKQKGFRLSLAQQLNGQYCGRMHIGRPRLSTTPHPQPLHHTATHFPRKCSQKEVCVLQWLSQSAVPTGE